MLSLILMFGAGGIWTALSFLVTSEEKRKRGRAVSTEDVPAVVDAFRKSLIMDELLPEKHDNYHTMLRCPILVVLICYYILW